MCLAYQSTTATVAVDVVEVDTLGSVRSVQPADVPYVPTDAAVAKQVRDFITVTRGLSVDGKLLHDQWEWAFAICTQRAAQVLNAYAVERALHTKLGKEAIAVDITRVLRATETSWDVAWQETTVDKNGNQLTQEHWSGLFTVALRQPKTDVELRVNPLGIWIDALSWTKN